jgi:hypothetical protein
MQLTFLFVENNKKQKDENEISIYRLAGSLNCCSFLQKR